MENQEEKLKKLKEYFEKNDDVVMAFLFGSQAKERAVSRSDWDIGVYLTKEDRDLEQKIWLEIERIVLSEVDLIILNRAPATVADSCLRGIQLTVKDRKLWLNFLLKTTSEATDFREFSNDYAQIYWRSASVTKQDEYALNLRLTFIDEELNVLKDFSDLTWAEYQSDRIKRSVAERSIEKIMNAVIDISKVVLASQKKPIPETYKETMLKVGLIKPFSNQLTARLAGWINLRNILAHEYLDYRFREISDFLKNHGPLIRSFVELAKQYVLENKI